MAYTKKYKVQLVSIIAAVAVIITIFFAIGFSRYAYQRGLEDGLLYGEQLKEHRADSIYLNNRLKLNNGY